MLFDSGYSLLTEISQIRITNQLLYDMRHESNQDFTCLPQREGTLDCSDLGHSDDDLIQPTTYR